jgi:hypothetical protein
MKKQLAIFFATKNNLQLYSVIYYYYRWAVPGGDDAWIGWLICSGGDRGSSSSNSLGSAFGYAPALEHATLAGNVLAVLG